MVELFSCCNWAAFHTTFVDTDSSGHLTIPTCVRRTTMASRGGNRRKAPTRDLLTEAMPKAIVSKCDEILALTNMAKAASTFGAPFSHGMWLLNLAYQLSISGRLEGYGYLMAFHW